MIVGSDRKKRRKKVIPKKNQGFRNWRGGRWKQTLFAQVMIKTILLTITCFCFWLFLVNNNNYFLLANADLLKISIFIFFTGTYLQKSQCVMVENIPSNKAQLQLNEH